MKQYKNHLEAKVGERNNVNRQTLSLLPVIIDALRPFVGKKVLNQGCVISQKVKDALPKFSDTPALSVYYSASRYGGLSVTFKTTGHFPSRFPDTHTACYAECTMHLGDTGYNDFILTTLADRVPNLRTDYTVEEVQQARQELSSAMDAKHAAESKLCYFGNHDNH